MHGDIKLENMVYGGPPGSPHYNRVYLIDFGLCSKYLLPDGSHIQKVTTQRFVGNFMFCSLNICRTTNKSRRDDFESIFYILIYLLNKFRLPWSKLATLKPYTPERMGYILGERLSRDMIDQVISLCPASLRPFLIDAQKAKFESTPNYQGLRNALMSELYRLRKVEQSPMPGSDNSPSRQQENADSWGSAALEELSAGNQSQPRLLGNS